MNRSRRDILTGGIATSMIMQTPFIQTAQARGASGANLLGYRLTRWRNDRFALGSYSYLAKGATPKDRKVLGKPVDSALYFAGEATDKRAPGMVHGALHSGIKAAKQVIAAKRRKVAIVGAGMSGLAAAQLLRSKGHQVTVFEASNRIGGRIWTDRTLGLPLDMGASWIHGARKNPLVKMAKKAKAGLVRTDYDSAVLRNQQGQVVTPYQLDPALEEIVEVEHEYGADLAAMSKLALSEGDMLRGGDFVFPNGYDQILPHLVAGLDIRLSSWIKSIKHNNKGAKVNWGAASEGFDAVIVTVPLGVLKTSGLSFSPALPADKQAAIKRLGMGVLDKVYLKFDRVFWDKEVDFITYSGRPHGYYSAWVNMAKYTGQPVLMAFNAAGYADNVARLSDGQIVKQAMAVLANMYR